MTPALATVFVALVLLQFKHLVADFALQTPTMIREKATYGSSASLLHAAIHVIGSAPVVLWLATESHVIGLILAAEFLIHYHIDWFKETLSRRLDMAPNQTRFWFAMGTDQMLHQLTYIGMVWWIVG